MFDVEARIIAEVLESLPGSIAGKTILDIGSSTARYRDSKPQCAYLHSRIIEGGGLYLGLDIKQSEGVDIVGDIKAAETLEQIRAIAPDAILLNNLLEHLEEPWQVLQNVWGVAPAGSTLIVTVPSEYPYHPDPIDTMLRPSPEAIASKLPGAEVIKMQTLVDQTLLVKWLSRGVLHMLYRLFRSVAKTVVKTPFDIRYLVYSDIRWMFKNPTVSLVAARKPLLTD